MWNTSLLFDLNYKFELIRGASLLALAKSIYYRGIIWRKGVHCWNVTVKNKANLFSFQKANLPIFIHNYYSRSYYSPDLKTVPTYFVSPIFGPKNREKMHHIVSLLAEAPVLLKRFKKNLFGFWGEGTTHYRNIQTDLEQK